MWSLNFPTIAVNLWHVFVIIGMLVELTGGIYYAKRFIRYNRMDMQNDKSEKRKQLKAVYDEQYGPLIPILVVAFFLGTVADLAVYVVYQIIMLIINFVLWILGFKCWFRDNSVWESYHKRHARVHDEMTAHYRKQAEATIRQARAEDPDH